MPSTKICDTFPGVKKKPEAKTVNAKPVEQRKDSADRRVDDWGSMLMGMGMAGNNKVSSFTFTPGALQFDKESVAESAYQQDDMVERVVDQIPDEALAKLFTLDGDDIDEEIGIVEEMDDSGALDSLIQSWKFSRLYGGGSTWVLAEDGRTQDQPIDMKGIKSIIGFREFTSFELTPNTFYTDVMRFGQPETYVISASNGGTAESGVGVVIHESRIIPFKGAPPQRSQRNSRSSQWWGLSILERVFSAIQLWQLGYSAASNIMVDGAQAVFTVDGLKALLASGKHDLVLKRMQTIQLSRSVARSIMIDKTDGYHREPHNMTGLGEILNKFDQRLASAVGYPVTVLMGTSPGGLNATGASDMQIYYRKVTRERKRHLSRKLHRMVELFLADQSRDFGNITNWKISYPAMYEMSDTENATYRKTIAETDKLYIDSGVVLAEEVAKSRFREDGWNAETTIDLELREEPVPDTSSKDPNAGTPPDAMPSEVEVDTEELAGETPPPAGSADMSPDAEEVDAAKQKK